jgi:RNA polymerase sigma-70 factor (ECF subfamily)
VSYLREVELDEGFGPFVGFRESFGFVPNLFRAQTILPRVIEAEAGIAGAVLLTEGALTRMQKESILLAVAAADRNLYCVAAHRHSLQSLGMTEPRIDGILRDHRRSGLPGPDVALLDYALELGLRPGGIGGCAPDSLRRRGFTDEAILEAVLVTSLTKFLCTLSVGLGPEPDFPPPDLPPRRNGRPHGGSLRRSRPRQASSPGAPGPYLRAVDRSPEEFPAFALLRDSFGFVPNLFRAQTLRPDVVEAEARVVGAVLLTGDVLPRTSKEYILLVISAANLNSYCVAVHCEMLRGLGIPESVSDQIALDHRLADLPEPETALLDFALRLGRRPADFRAEDLAPLRLHGFTEEQILEAVVMSSLTSFLNTLQAGLGTVPDFTPRIELRAKGVNLSTVPPRPTEGGRLPAVPVTGGGDADAGLVERARKGDLEAFEELVRRHNPRVYRLLIRLTGRPEDAEDACQAAFLKAFEHLHEFRGASRFSTWLTRIALNEAVQGLRGRREPQRLDPDRGDEREPYRPHRLQAWEEDPERRFSQVELRELVEKEVRSLPERYRTAVILRDLEQMSTEEAAEALGVGVSTFKTRLLRGRLMLREALAPHFTRKGGGTKGA